jgi:acetyltransferase-like isoleucine patch superfamily enzyme
MKSKLNFPNNINRLLLSETPLWAGWIGLCNLGSKVKSMCLSRLLNAPGLHLGPGCVVRGSKFIHFVRNVYVHGHLWMEAIATYGTRQFSPGIEIGDDVSFSEGVHITCIDRISIGRGLLFGSRVYVSDHNHGIYKGPLQSHPQEPPTQRQLGGGGVVEIGDPVWIGDNAVIVGPITIARGSIVGANSVVRADVPEFTMVGGIPARALKRFEQATGQWEKL